MTQMIRSFTYNYVCRSLHGNRGCTVVKLRGYRLGARVLFLAEALVFSLPCPELGRVVI